LLRCSDGIDRHRQEWLDYNCSEEAKRSCADYSPWGTDATSPPSLWTSNGSTSSSSLLHLPEADVTQTGPPHPRMTENTAIIAGVVAALVVLVVLTLLAVYYINTHPTVAPPFYLMQRRTNNYWPSMKFRNQGCHSTYAEVEIGVHEKEGFIEAEHCC
ncbi:plexin domain-containing protein 1-like, partial [Gadus chalcogrammus]|uniref:plexin domain-containing protein 1-like n=1 Tax=Gadus chalcogrammus TaxID=1042646 RepID=UPI0024C4B0BD